MATPKALIIDGYTFPIAYDGYKHSRNKIWSANAGRNNKGNSVGTILAIKNKIEVVLRPITPSEAEIIDEIISDIDNPFKTAKILYLDGTQKNITIYTGDVTYEWLSGAIGEKGLIKGISFSCIEQ